MGFSGGSLVKNPLLDAEDSDSIPGEDWQILLNLKFLLMHCKR